MSRRCLGARGACAEAAVDIVTAAEADTPFLHPRMETVGAIGATVEVLMGPFGVVPLPREMETVAAIGAAVDILMWTISCPARIMKTSGGTTHVDMFSNSMGSCVSL